MAVLSRVALEERCRFSPDLIQDASADCFEVASYNLRLGATDVTVGGIHYCDYDGAYVTLPPRRISRLASLETISVPWDLCAKVGITFSWSQRGLISLFGPLVDPGYVGRFYATIYNITDTPIRIRVGEPFLKMELHTVHMPAVPGARPLLEIFDPELTAGDSVGGLIVEVQRLRKEMDKQDSELTAVTAGYQNVLLFGVFLIAGSLFGGAMSFMLAAIDKMPAPPSGAPTWAPWLLPALGLVVCVSVAVIGLMVAVNIVRRRKSHSKGRERDGN